MFRFQILASLKLKLYQNFFSITQNQTKIVHSRGKFEFNSHQESLILNPSSLVAIVPDKSIATTFSEMSVSAEMRICIFLKFKFVEKFKVSNSEVVSNLSLSVEFRNKELK